MSRELRRVSKDWKHPTRPDGSYIPLYEGDDYEEHKERCCGEADEPDPDGYMPCWPMCERTHFQMYESVSEGTPISPVFDNIEDLARWLADTKASAFGHESASYEHWLAMCKEGWVPSSVMENGRWMSGVEAVGRKSDDD